LGCIFAEILGRKVLFKGADYVDQLHKIIAIVGMPKDASFWSKMASPSVIEYIQNLRSEDGSRPPTEPIDFHTLYPQGSSSCIDLLTRMLQLDPAKRITVDEALEHPFLADFRDPEEEINCPRSFAFEPFENVDSIDSLRELIVQEVHNFGAAKSMSTGSSYSRRRYTGSSIATRRSTMLTEANEQAVASIQDNTSSLVTSEAHLVGEPEDMMEDEDRHRKLVPPQHVDVQAIERQLSGVWHE